MSATEGMGLSAVAELMHSAPTLLEVTVVNVHQALKETLTRNVWILMNVLYPTLAVLERYVRICRVPTAAHARKVPCQTPIQKQNVSPL